MSLQLDLLNTLKKVHEEHYENNMNVVHEYSKFILRLYPDSANAVEGIINQSQVNEIKNSPNYSPNKSNVLREIKKNFRPVLRSKLERVTEQVQADQKELSTDQQLNQQEDQVSLDQELQYQDEQTTNNELAVHVKTKKELFDLYPALELSKANAINAYNSDKLKEIAGVLGINIDNDDVNNIYKAIKTAISDLH